jgi:hypothetical protein
LTALEKRISRSRVDARGRWTRRMETTTRLEKVVDKGMRMMGMRELGTQVG